MSRARMRLLSPGLSAGMASSHNVSKKREAASGARGAFNPKP